MLLWMTTRGEGTLEIAERGGELFHVECEDCFLLNMERTTFGSNSTDSPLEVYAVGFKPLDETGNELPVSAFRFKTWRRLNNLPFMQNLLESAIKAHQSGRSEQAVQWLRAALLNMEEQDAAQIKSGVSLELGMKIDELCTEIRRRPDEKRSVNDLARRLHMSREHFQRIFKQHRSVSPGEYIILNKIEAAKERLRFSSGTIRAIARDLNYNSSGFFTRQFKSVTGMTPGEYRSSSIEIDYGNIP